MYVCVTWGCGVEEVSDTCPPCYLCSCDSYTLSRTCAEFKTESGWSGDVCHHSGIQTQAVMGTDSPGLSDWWGICPLCPYMGSSICPFFLEYINIFPGNRSCYSDFNSRTEHCPNFSTPIHSRQYYPYQVHTERCSFYSITGLKPCPSGQVCVGVGVCVWVWEITSPERFILLQARGCRILIKFITPR